ncbi:hypothetical protein MOV66_02375 [Agrobacterium sp. SHOUNA12C]|nr:hypothetical protein [Agrobacterium sp. BETTINA12B]MCJ9755480.1 hypothetical protein [Agrobacterium sp. SHOUNA12C]NTG34813.1 hypothetical protein [Rhizobium rhizogenes]NTG54062.1 hypothetical protein [Rhizobium rhizogenes]
MPRSLWLLVFTAVVLILQYVPPLDAILMILGASVWPIITVNLAFAGIVSEVASGTVPRLWLALPILYFGGNLVLASVSEYQFLHLMKEVEATNAGQSLPFAREDSLVIETRQPVVGPVPLALIETYDIPKVYEKDPSTKRPLYAWRIAADPLCKKLWKDQRDPKSNILTHGVVENGKLVSGMCAYRLTEAPSGRVLSLTVGKPTEHESFLLPYKKQVITIADNMGKSVELLYAEATPWFWLPMPVGGCFRGPGESKSRCFFEPLRIFTMPALGSVADTPALVAKALNLNRSPASRRRDEISSAGMLSDLRPSLSF